MGLKVIVSSLYVILAYERFCRNTLLKVVGETCVYLSCLEVFLCWLYHKYGFFSQLEDIFCFLFIFLLLKTSRTLKYKCKIYLFIFQKNNKCSHTIKKCKADIAKFLSSLPVTKQNWCRDPDESRPWGKQRSAKGAGRAGNWDPGKIELAFQGRAYKCPLKEKYCGDQSWLWKTSNWVNGGEWLCSK